MDDVPRPPQAISAARAITPAAMLKRTRNLAPSSATHPVATTRSGGASRRGDDAPAGFSTRACEALRRDERALRVEVLDVAALGSGGRVDDRVDQRRLAGRDRFAHRVLQALRVVDVVAGAAERFDDLVVPRVREEAGRRRLGAGFVAAVD